MTSAITTQFNIPIYLGGNRNQETSPPLQTEIPLEGAELTRLHHFFKEGRPYLYDATLQTPFQKDPVSLQFPFSLLTFLKRTVGNLKTVGIEVKGVYLKGGAVHRILSDSSKPLADLDLVIELEDHNQWALGEQAIFDALGKDLPIHHFEDSTGQNYTYFSGETPLCTTPRPFFKESKSPVFTLKGARTNRVLITRDDSFFSLFTIPALHDAKTSQPIDLQLHVRSQNSCFNSNNALQINISPLLEHSQQPITIRAVGGFDVKLALELRKKGICSANLEQMKTIRKGFLGHCHNLTRGNCPQEIEQVENILREKFEQDYPKAENFKKDLRDFLKNHYSQDPKGKIFFLLNCYSLISRKIAAPDLETFILDELYSSANLKRPENLDAKKELELIFAYFYQQHRRTQIDSLHALCSPGKENFLLSFSSTAPLSVEIQKAHDLYPLLAKWVPQGAKKAVPVESKSNPTPSKNHSETPIQGFSPLEPSVLEHSFQELCKNKALRAATKMYQQILQEPRLEPLKFLAIFHSFVKEEIEAKKLIQMVEATIQIKGFESCAEWVHTLGDSHLRKFPNILSDLVSFMKSLPRESIVSHLKTLLKNPPPLLHSYLEKLGSDVWIEDPEIALFYLEGIKNPKNGIDFYKKGEPTFLRSPLFPQAFAIYMRHAWKGKPDSDLISRGIERIFSSDKKSSELISQLSNHAEQLKKMPRLVAQLKKIEEEIPEHKELGQLVRRLQKPEPPVKKPLSLKVIKKPEPTFKPELIVLPEYIKRISIIEAHLEAGRYPDLLKEAEKALNDFPNNLDVRISIAGIYEQLMDQFYLQKNKGLQLIPDLDLSIRNLLTRMAKNYVHCSKLAPENLHWMNGYIFCCLRLGYLDKAKKTLDFCMEKTKDNPHPDIVMNFAEYHAKTNNFDLAAATAQRAFDQYLAENIDEAILAQTAIILSNYYLASSEPQKAIEVLEKVLPSATHISLLEPQIVKALFARATYNLERCKRIADKEKQKEILIRSEEDLLTSLIHINLIDDSRLQKEAMNLLSLVIGTKLAFFGDTDRFLKSDQIPE